MEKLRTDLIGSANSILAIGTANTVTSAIVRFILVEIPQLAGNGLKAKAYGTAQTAIGYIPRKRLNA